MRIALAIVKLFATGGLQRDCMAIARRLVAQGHDVEIVCESADAPPDDLDVVVLANSAWTNHGRNTRFSRDLQRHVAKRFDVVAGFDALEGLDVLYCANPPTKTRGVLDRVNPRKRAQLHLEAACFGRESTTRLLLLSEPQRAAYDARWSLDLARVTLIPPTIERSRVVPDGKRGAERARMRAAIGVADDTPVWLFVGGFPKTKGLDRVIAAMNHFPDARLLCVGAQGEAVAQFRAQAKEAGVASRVSWLGARDDVPALMVASDVLVHPARLDVTGTVILEAIANGLPVIATAVGGYAPHIAESGAGRVLAEPFSLDEMVAALRGADASTREQWRSRADRYAASTDLYSGLDVAAAAIAGEGNRRPHGEEAAFPATSSSSASGRLEP